jgi:type I restriction enzyme S subunit
MNNTSYSQSFNLGHFCHVRGRIGWKGLKSNEYTQDGPFLVAGTHIKGDKIQWDKCQHISKFRYDESPEIKLILKDIIISKDGTIGRVALVDYLPGPTTINSTMMLVRLKEQASLCSVYVFYFLQGEVFQKLVAERVAGSGVPHLFQADMKTLTVYAPSEIPKQQKIAKILTTVDNLIEKTQALIDKYTAIKQGMMADLFTRGIDLSGTPDTNPYHGQLRPPVEQAPELYKQTELGWVPKEWEAEQLGVIAEFWSGYAFKNHELTEHGLKAVRITNLHRPDFVYWRYDGDYKNTWVVEDGDLLFSWAGVASSIDAYIYRGERALLNQHIYNFRISSSVLKRHVYNYLQFLLPSLREEIEGGAGQLHLNKGKIQSILIPKPDSEELEKIVEISQSLELKIENETKYRSSLLNIKKGLMQDLLTGKVKVT